MRSYTRSGIKVIVPQRVLSGGNETDTLDLKLKEVLDGEVKQIVIDCSEMKHMNSTELGVLISAHSRAIRTGGQVVLANVHPTIEKIFVSTKLSLVFDVYPTVALAIAALTQTQREI